MNININISKMPDIIIKQNDDVIFKCLKFKNITKKIELVNLEYENKCIFNNKIINNHIPFIDKENHNNIITFIENYIQHKIENVKEVYYKFIEFKIEDNNYNVYINGKADGLIKIDNENILVKITNKKKLSSLNNYDKIRLELYLRAYNLNKAANFQICKNNLLTVYYEKDDEFFKIIQNKFNNILINILKKN